MMRPTMARPRPVPLALVLLNTVRKRLPPLFLAHALAGVLEFQFHVRRFSRHQLCERHAR